jgi:secondary thiamine-phosphate synthase enzyme
MEWFSDTLSYSTNGKGLTMITADIARIVVNRGIYTGMCFIFLPHTSASLTMCENYDPESRVDVVNYYEHAVPENQPWYEHTIEGSDDSPSHIRSTLTQTSFTIPIDQGKLSLGMWQGIFLFEHRAIPHQRNLSIRCLKID